MAQPAPDRGAADLVILRRAIDERLEGIVDAYIEELVTTQSPLAGLPRSAQTSIVAALLTGLLTGDPQADSQGAARGRAHAEQRISPIHALRALRILGRIVSADIARISAAQGLHPDAPARALHDLFASLMRRVESSGGAYAVTLLRDVHTSHLAERRRIARELHDRVAHALAIAQQQAELRGLAADRADAASAERHDRLLLTALQEATTVVRDLAEDIGQTKVDQGLVRAVEDYADLVGTDVVTVTTCGPDRLTALPLWAAEEFFLAIRESIRNAVEHAEAERIAVELLGQPLHSIARITDDGDGFIPADVANPSAGRGLSAVRERIELLGGVVTIDSAPGRGTTVTLVVPELP
ncbi:sensor histidine kinase [Enemella evansiae]|uniref:sensor histidine kinase n=1 Tax=Enemella evansiae TaxID=2016499 RepID=UPI000B965A4D|nr:ATP-binding protein [Enemella evansiae]OYO00110.1 hypothetical protein CGZ97_18900 [Enemella evansiae]